MSPIHSESGDIISNPEDLKRIIPALDFGSEKRDGFVFDEICRSCLSIINDDPQKTHGMTSIKDLREAGIPDEIILEQSLISAEIRGIIEGQNEKKWQYRP